MLGDGAIPGPSDDPAIAGPSGDGPLDWQFMQCFGERTPDEEIQEADIISAIEFDRDGQHLATGDRGGRVVLFERIPTQPRFAGIDQRTPGRGSASSRGCAFEYRYLTEFQSHEPEFDYLKSLEIEEKINKVRWVNHASASRLLLSANDKTIKLWKVYEKKNAILVNFNRQVEEAEAQQPWSIAAGNTAAAGLNGVRHLPPPSKLAALTEQKLQTMLRFPQVVSVEVVLAARCRRAYANAHTYHINSLSLSSDGETFLTADDLRVHVWHLDCADRAFNVVDIKPANMEDLTEVITAADFHPSACHTFAYSTSKGCIRLADLRAGALADCPAAVFEEADPAGTRSFFAEIISSISDLKFARDGRYVLARDYMSLKLWDLRSTAAPAAVVSVHEHLRGRLCDLYENDHIFDKFDCCVGPRAEHLATGSYSNLFAVLPARGGRAAAAPDALLEASRDPQRRRLQPPKAAHRHGPRGSSTSASKRPAGAAVPPPPPPEAPPPDFAAKLLHLAWHPEANVIAAAASNSLYMYCAR